MVEIKGTVSVIYAGQTTAVAFLYVHTLRLKTEKNKKQKQNKTNKDTQLRKQMRDFRFPISNHRFPTSDSLFL